MLTWRDVGPRRAISNVDGDRRSPVVTVAGISALFFCCTIMVTVALGVFCRKRNTVFPLVVNSDAEEDDDIDDCNGDEALGSTSKIAHHNHQTRFDSNTADIHSFATSSEPDRPLQLSPTHAANTLMQSSVQNDVNFRLTSDAVDNSVLPVASVYVQDCATDCCCESDVQREDFCEVKSRSEHSLQEANNDGSITATSQLQGSITDVTASSSSLQPLFSLLSSLHRPQIVRSLGHVFSDVINWRWIRRRAPVVTAGNQSATIDAASDEVDLTSLLPTL